MRKKDIRKGDRSAYLSTIFSLVAKQKAFTQIIGFSKGYRY